MTTPISDDMEYSSIYGYYTILKVQEEPNNNIFYDAWIAVNTENDARVLEVVEDTIV